ncbi:MAG: DUF4404 family protein [Pirellulales bacterium]
MPDDAPDLQRTLSELHRQLEAAGSVDPEIRELLKRLMRDIDRVLDEKAEADERRSTHESLVSRLGETARHFEETHPTLSGAVGSVIDALSRMGI